LEQTHKEFGVSISTIRDWERLRAENGSLTKRELSREPRIYRGEELRAYIDENPDAFLREIAAHFGGSAVGAHNALKREGITYKKNCDYSERDEEKRAAFEEELAAIPPETPVVYVDQCGVNKHLHRTMGRAPRGKKVKMKHPGRRYKRCNIIAGLCGQRVIAEQSYGWSTDSVWVADWLEGCLIPQLTAKSVIIMDNAPFHNKQALNTIAEAYGHRILWLPAYSPDKNRIEKVWANLKKWLRAFSHLFVSIHLAIRAYFQSKPL